MCICSVFVKYFLTLIHNSLFHFVFDKYIQFQIYCWYNGHVTVTKSIYIVLSIDSIASHSIRLWNEYLRFAFIHNNIRTAAEAVRDRLHSTPSSRCQFSISIVEFSRLLFQYFRMFFVCAFRLNMKRPIELNYFSAFFFLIRLYRSVTNLFTINTFCVLWELECIEFGVLVCFRLHKLNWAKNPGLYNTFKNITDIWTSHIFYSIIFNYPIFKFRFYSRNGSFACCAKWFNLDKNWCRIFFTRLYGFHRRTWVIIVLTFFDGLH